jgi:hypothetical protein
MARPSLKADFIRSQPLDVPIKDVQRAGKRAGVGDLAKSYISKVRSEMNVQQGVAAVRRADAAAAAVKPAAVMTTVNTAQPEQQLRAIVVVLGTARVRQIIDELEAQLMRGPSA